MFESLSRGPRASVPAAGAVFRGTAPGCGAREASHVRLRAFAGPAPSDKAGPSSASPDPRAAGDGPAGRSGRVWCGEASHPAGHHHGPLRLPPQRSVRPGTSDARHARRSTWRATLRQAFGRLPTWPTPITRRARPRLPSAPALRAARFLPAARCPAPLLPARIPARSPAGPRPPRADRARRHRLPPCLVRPCLVKPCPTRRLPGRLPPGRLPPGRLLSGRLFLGRPFRGWRMRRRPRRPGPRRRPCRRTCCPSAPPRSC